MTCSRSQAYARWEVKELVSSYHIEGSCDRKSCLFSLTILPVSSIATAPLFKYEVARKAKKFQKEEKKRKEKEKEKENIRNT